MAVAGRQAVAVAQMDVADPLAGIDDRLGNIDFLNGQVEEVSDQAHILGDLGISQFQNLHAVAQAGQILGLIAVAGLDQHIRAVFHTAAQFIYDL